MLSKSPSCLLDVIWVEHLCCMCLHSFWMNATNTEDTNQPQDTTKPENTNDLVTDLTNSLNTKQVNLLAVRHAAKGHIQTIAPHVWLFRPSYRASCRFSHSELLLKWCFSHSCMLLQIKASASWTDGEIFTVIVFQPNSLELFCFGFKDPLLPEEIISLLKLTYSLNFCLDLLLQLFPHNWYICCILDIIQLFKLFFSFSLPREPFMLF